MKSAVIKPKTVPIISTISLFEITNQLVSLCRVLTNTIESGNPQENIYLNQTLKYFGGKKRNTEAKKATMKLANSIGDKNPTIRSYEHDPSGHFIL